MGRGKGGRRKKYGGFWIIRSHSTWLKERGLFQSAKSIRRGKNNAITSSEQGVESESVHGASLSVKGRGGHGLVSPGSAILPFSLRPKRVSPQLEAFQSSHQRNAPRCGANGCNYRYNADPREVSLNQQNCKATLFLRCLYNKLHQLTAILAGGGISLDGLLTEKKNLAVEGSTKIV